MTAALSYAQDYDEFLCVPYPLPFAPFLWWNGGLGDGVFAPYVRNSGIFVCPSRAQLALSYGISVHDMGYYYGSYEAKSLGQITNPANTIYLGDNDTWRPINTLYSENQYLYGAGTYGANYFMMSMRHNGGGNYAFVDGHAKWLSQQAVSGDPNFTKYNQ